MYSLGLLLEANLNKSEFGVADFPKKYSKVISISTRPTFQGELPLAISTRFTVTSHSSRENKNKTKSNS